MIGFIIVVCVLLLLFSIASAARRTARQSRRVPCKACGEPLLARATVCPNCGGPGAWKPGLIEKLRIY